MSQHSKRKSKTKKRPQSSTSSDTIEDFLDNPNEPNFEIKVSPIMGRYMISRRNLKPGEIILSEFPLVVGPCTGCKVQCIACYQPLTSTNCKKCKNCQWPLCSQKCKQLKTKYGHTEIECEILKKSNSAKFLNYNNFDEMKINFHAIVPLRCLLLKESDFHTYQELLKMENHNKIRRNIPELWKTNQVTIVDKIRKDWKLEEFSEDEIHSICGVLEVNSFEIGQHGVNIRGIYPTAFLMSHDCIPNTNHIDDDITYKLTVRASTKICKNNIITLSYAYTLQSTLKRREHLLENKFFECKCLRCQDPTEFKTFTGALLCPKCENGFVLSTNPLNPAADWKCVSKTCPGYKLSSRSMQMLIEKISQEVERIDSNDIVGFESFLQKYRNVLHPTHFLNLSAKLSLSQLYGRISGYLIDELSEDLLVRKQEICEEILGVFDVVEPGLTRLRGVTLYELHAPLMIFLTRRFERSCSKSELRGKLRRVVKCLEEASLILGYEPKCSTEGIMGLAAKDALRRIKDWEKILGKF